MKLPIIQKRKIYFTFSTILIVVSLLSLIAWGLKPGIDFTGGSLLEVQFEQRPQTDEIQNSLKDFDLGDVNVQSAGQDKAIIRFKDIDEDTHHEIITKLKEDFRVEKETKEEVVDNSEDETEEEKDDENSNVGLTITDEQGNEIEGAAITGVSESGQVVTAGSTDVLEIKEPVVELRFESIGPSIGQELRSKSYKAMLYVVIAIILYVAWAFRKVSKPVNSWKYGVIAVIALLHDVLITVGVFVFLGHFMGVEVNTPFIAALLTILGYSVNDSIVVFDRVRENLHRYHENFEETVNDSVNETITRSINTSVTTIFVLLAVYFFGGETIKSFVLALIVGMAVGTYSSIFIASPLLVTWHKLSEKFR